MGAGVPPSLSPLPLLHPWIVILTPSTTAPPVTLVVVTPLLLVVVLKVKLEFVKPVTLHLPLARTVCDTPPFTAGGRARKRVKEPLPLSWLVLFIPPLPLISI